MSSEYANAASQIERIAKLCDFLEHEGVEAAIKSHVPVTMPQSVGALGFDGGVWLGLGVVGIWAALDAYAERTGLPRARCPVCGRKACLSSRLSVTRRIRAPGSVALAELEDVRHLFAHNFSAQADALYFKWPRHTVIAGTSAVLSSGASFDGSRLTLHPPHLRFYAARAREVLAMLV